MSLTNAQIVLAAVQAAADSDLPFVHLLTQRHKLKADLVLRILLAYLPETVDPFEYIPLLRELNGEGVGLPESLAEAAEHNEKKEPAGSEEAEKKVRTLRLTPLTVEDTIERAPSDSLTTSLTIFLLLRARRIDAHTGLLPLVQKLIEPFVEQSAFLKLWLGSTLLPILRLNFEIRPDDNESLSLEEFEALRGGAALDSLIGRGSGSTDDYVRDLQQIAGPWICGEIYRRKHRRRRDSATKPGVPADDVPSTCWSWINNWLIHIATKDPHQALAIARRADWTGPGDVDDGGWIGDDQNIMLWIWGDSNWTTSKSFADSRQNFLKSCLCLFYIVNDASEQTFDALEELLRKTAELNEQDDVVQKVLNASSADDDSFALPDAFLDSVQSKVYRLQPAELLEDGHPLTLLDSPCFALASHLLRAGRVLLQFKQTLSISKVLHTCFLGTANEQRTLLQRTTQRFEDKKNNDGDCDEMRSKILDVSRNPRSDKTHKPYGIFGKVLLETPDDIDILILRAELNAARYHHIIKQYLDPRVERLSREVVGRTVIQAALAAYDNASNGNRTRGGVKVASDIVTAFNPRFADSQELREIEALIRATHALSFYRLILQYEKPCAPANIRAHPQPLSLVEKVLAQNSASYTQLENLSSIGVDLVRAGLVKSDVDVDPSQHHSSTSSDQSSLEELVRRQVTAKAIYAALEEDDFDTAYSYITTRLATQSSASKDDDVLWRAAYEAGRSSPPSASGPRHLRRLEQKMELLSQALSLAPPSALAELLNTWKECEALVNEALAAEDDEEKRWNDQGDKGLVSDRHLPGGFGAEAFIPHAEGGGGRQLRSGRGISGEAPMGLFDVARAAGSALQNSAFPIRGSGQTSSAQSGATAEATNEAHRVRKRDMVSSAVTDGLVSGLGWVLGATPAKETT